MQEFENTSDASSNWPSVDDERPREEGGPTARTGFNYQDEIAAGFLIQMLESPSILKVHCETHDDIVVVMQDGDTAVRTAEYVQVKAGEEDKFWSIADMCQRKKGKVGSSIFETSLERDCHAEASKFRLVTLRPVAAELRVLTYNPLAPEHQSRVSQLSRRRAEVTSLREATLAYPPAESAAKEKQAPPLAREVAADWHQEKAEEAAVPEPVAVTQNGQSTEPAGTVEQPKVEAPKKRTLARQVSDEGRGENDRRSDDEIMEAIRQTTEAVKAKMNAFDARLLGKKKAA